MNERRLNMMLPFRLSFASPCATSPAVPIPSYYGTKPSYQRIVNVQSFAYSY